MNDQFFSALKARLSELVQDLRYLHPPSAALIAPQIIDIMLPRPTGAVAEGDEYPFVRWAVYKGECGAKGLAAFWLMIDGGICVDGDVASGNAAINQLCLRLLGLLDTPRFAMYRVGEEPVRFFMGNMDAETMNPGVQSHPYYHCRLLVPFLASRSRLG